MQDGDVELADQQEPHGSVALEALLHPKLTI
jgi:hypothetical protein